MVRTPRLLLLALAFTALPLSSGCTEKEEPAAIDDGTTLRNDPPVVVTTIEVNRFLAARIAGDRCAVTMPIPADVDPLHWEPSREAIAALQGADRVLLNGAGLETWTSRVSLAPSRTVKLANAYRRQWLTIEEAVEHQHGPEGAHTHTGSDPHVWFDPQLLKAHVDRIAATLAEILPDHAAEFSARALELHADLESLDAAFEAIEGLPPLLANHPAYDYAVRRYGWDIENHDLDPAVAPSADVVAELRESGRSIILWGAEPSAAARAALDAVGIDSVVISACEHPPENGDWLSVMRENAAKLASLAR